MKWYKKPRLLFVAAQCKKSRLLFVAAQALVFFIPLVAVLQAFYAEMEVAVADRAALAIPGGFKADDIVYFAGTSESFENGDRLVYGGKGTVKGPSKSEGRVAVLFEGNKLRYGCLPTDLNRQDLSPSLCDEALLTSTAASPPPLEPASGGSDHLCEMDMSWKLVLLLPFVYVGGDLAQLGAV